MILFGEAIRLSYEKEDNIWIDSEAQKMYLQFLLLFPIGGVSDRSRSVGHSTFNAVTMVMIEHCVTWLKT